MGNFQSETENKFLLRIRKVKKYGAIPDIPDQRDLWTVFPETVKYYNTIDLRKLNFFPDIYDQGELGSSVAHALLACYIFSLKKDGIYNYESSKLSPQFIYYNQRVISNTTECDTGASIRDGIKVLERLGVCNEELYPYNPFFFRDRPTIESYENAMTNKYKQSIQYRRIKPIIEEIMKSISIKLPVIMGFTLYDSFEHPDVARTGIMPIPKSGEKIIGHHAVLIVGYDIPRKYVLCRSSWGINFGQGGHFWIPFQLINSRYCSDLWIISSGSNRSTSNLMGTEKIVEKVEKIVEKVPKFKEDDSDNEDNDQQENVID